MRMVAGKGKKCDGHYAQLTKDNDNERDGQHAYNDNHEKTELSVQLVDEASGAQPVNGKYDLIITSTPPCALPLFQNCSGRDFDPTQDEWKAYSTGDFLTRYLADNQLNTSTDVLLITDAQSLICTPDARDIYNCDYPSFTQCDSSSTDTTSGYLVVAAIVRMNQLLTLIHNAVSAAQVDLAGYITQTVVKIFQPQAEQKWQAILTTVSSIIGLFTFIAILIGGFTGFTATPALVAAIVGIQAAHGTAANFANGLNGEKPDATYLAIVGNYTQTVMDYAQGLQDYIVYIWSNADLDPVA
ncbi:MAG: hypothetical protein Q9221_005801 [Calogaya cf. arnoldii]